MRLTRFVRQSKSMLQLPVEQLKERFFFGRKRPLNFEIRVYGHIDQIKAHSTPQTFPMISEACSAEKSETLPLETIYRQWRMYCPLKRPFSPSSRAKWKPLPGRLGLSAWPRLALVTSFPNAFFVARRARIHATLGRFDCI